MTMVELKNIVKTFSGGNVAALRSVNLQLPQGTFATVLGPSGCGKSTLLRIIAGLEQPDAGEIVIGGMKVNDVKPSERNIAMVFQNYALYPHMKVRENIAVGLKLQGFSKTVIEKKVGEVCGMLGIAGLLGRYPAQLSGGQQQRVAIARALVKEPELFLLDEPLSNLDAQIREKTRGELKRLFSGLNATVLYVTHDQVEAMSMGDMMIVMESGGIRQVGSPQEVYENPADRFVAEFVGQHRTNMIKGNVEGGRFVSSDGSVTLSGAPSAEGAVWLGIRPEAVAVSDAGEGVEAEVLLAEHLGINQLLHCRIGENELLAVVDTSFKTKAGDSVTLAFLEGKRMWFDAATGKRIAL
jgi:ABC-type sugar transport system ATPase subunit